MKYNTIFGSDYTATSYINYLIQNYLNGSDGKATVAPKLAEILDNLNYLHPFREGNGRTQRETLRSLANSKGYKLKFPAKSDTIKYDKYMNGTINSDVPLLEEFMMDNLA